MSTVLAAIDAGPAASVVLAAAAPLADFFGARLEAVHVREVGEAAPREAAEMAGVPLHELRGHPIDAIVSAARAASVGVVVLGARSHPEGPRPAGHSAIQVMQHIDKPVCVIPPDARPRMAVGRLLVPLEGTEDTSAAVTWILDLGARRGAEIVVGHIHTPESLPAFEDQPQHAIEAWDREFVARYVTDGAGAVTFVRRIGMAAGQIVAIAQESEVDLIVLGWNQIFAPGRAVVVRQVLSESPVPVLLLPRSEPAAVAA